MTATARLQAARRLARDGEHVTITTQTRDVSVDPATGQHTYTDGKSAQNVRALVVDLVPQSRDVDDERDIGIKQVSVRVPHTCKVDLGQTVRIVAAGDSQLVGIEGTVTGVKRSGYMFRRFTFTTEVTP